MTNSTRQVQAFLIHAHANRTAVHKLYQRLRRDGIQAWLDRENLTPGQDWQREIRKALLESEAVIVCLSRKFDQHQGYRHEELKIALAKAKLLNEDEVFLIPVRLEPCEMPESLRHLHRVDLFEAGGYKKLLQALRERLPEL